MGLVLVLVLLALLFGGLGFLVKALWVVAAILVVAAFLRALAPR